MKSKLIAKLKVLFSILLCKSCIVIYVDDKSQSFHIYNMPIEQAPVMCDQTADMIDLLIDSQESESIGEELIKNIGKN